MTDDYLTFVHRFSRTVAVTLRVKDEPPTPGQMFALPCEWSGRPKPKHIAAYRQWILVTNQLLAERWGKSILYALGTAPNRTEFWSFQPGQTPKLTKKLNVGIP